MAKRVTNVFVDVTGRDARALIAQHQKHFPGNVIARFEVDGKTYVKVPYADGETRVAGITREQFEALVAGAPNGNVTRSG